VCVWQAVYLNSGISGFEFLDKIIQVPFCLPILELRKKQAFLSKIVEAKELEPKRVLMRVEHELQEAGLQVYIPLKPQTTSNHRLQALVDAARGMREAKLLVEDPMRRAEMGISEDGLIEQIAKGGDGARDDRMESFLFMLSEEAKAQKSKRLFQLCLRASAGRPSVMFRRCSGLPGDARRARRPVRPQRRARPLPSPAHPQRPSRSGSPCTWLLRCRACLQMPLPLHSPCSCSAPARARRCCCRRSPCTCGAAARVLADASAAAHSWQR
jgi:hypothetical protein